MTKTIINQPVQVTSVRFSDSFEPIPRRIEYAGRTLEFIGTAIRFCIKRNGNTTRILDMSDGEAWYSLRREATAGSWTLVSISR